MVVCGSPRSETFSLAMAVMRDGDVDGDDNRSVLAWLEVLAVLAICSCCIFYFSSFFFVERLVSIAERIVQS